MRAKSASKLIKKSILLSLETQKSHRVAMCMEPLKPNLSQVNGSYYDLCVRVNYLHSQR